MESKVKEIYTVDTHLEDLVQRSDEIDTKSEIKQAREIISYLKKTMQAKNLEYLSAPAVGFQKRIFCIQTKTEIKTFIDPLISFRQGLQFSIETSPIDPGKYYLRARNPEITLTYVRPTGQIEQKKLVGKISSLVQQMIDELDGILNSDIGQEVDKDFENLPDEEKLQIINDYIEQLDIMAKDMSEEVNSDDTGFKTMEAIRFIDSVSKGETVLDLEEKYT